MKDRKYDLIKLITELDDDADSDILDKMYKAVDFAYGDRTFYIADIQLDNVKNNGEIVLKTGWTRGTVKSRFSDKRNGYDGVSKIHKEYLLSPEMAEALNNYINDKFANGKNSRFNYMGKTETIDDSEYPIEYIIFECDYFIKKNTEEFNGRGKIN